MTQSQSVTVLSVSVRALSQIKQANQEAKSQKASPEQGRAVLDSIREMLGPKPVRRLTREERERAYLQHFFAEVFGAVK